MTTQSDETDSLAGLRNDLSQLSLIVQSVQRILKQPPGMKGTAQYLPDHAKTMMAELEKLRRQSRK